MLSEVQIVLQNFVCLLFSFLKFVALTITVSFELPSASYQPIIISCDSSFLGLVQVATMILSIDLSVFVSLKRKLLVCLSENFLHFSLHLFCLMFPFADVLSHSFSLKTVLLAHSDLLHHATSCEFYFLLPQLIQRISASCGCMSFLQ